MRRVKRVKPLKAAKPVKPVGFEKAVGWLRRGKAVRRREWHRESRIFRLGTYVFVKLPDSASVAPQAWRPYPHDILATDWELAR